MNVSDSTHGFDGIRAKIEKARERLHDVDDLVFEYLESDPYETVIYHKPGTDNFSIAWQVTRQPSHHVALAIGEFLYNLRSSLDHLAWELVKAAGNTPSIRGPRTQFPILTHQPSGPVMIPPGIEDSAQTIVNKVQPFHEGKRSDEHPLAMLNELGNRDKHRHLNLAAAHLAGAEVYVSDPSAGWRRGGRFIQDVVQHDDLIAQFKLPEGVTIDPKWEIEASGNTFVKLDERGPWDNEPLTPILQSLLVYVENEVVSPLLALY